MQRAQVICGLGVTGGDHVLGLRTLYGDAEPVRVLPGRAQNSVRVLVPDARAKPQGFHDVTLQDMTNVTGPAVSTAERCDLRRLWPQSLLSEMTSRQTDLGLLRRECKRRFRSLQAGACFGRQPIWRLWAIGDPQLVRMVPV